MSFKDIWLQDKAVEFLKKSIKNKRLSHSLLFFGPEGVGKHLAALTLAKALNCEADTQADSCDKCASCHKITSGNHPDIHWIVPEGAGNVIKIERIRAMRERISLRPFEGRTKVFIIDKAHSLAPEAANSILKTLEEPPKDTIIILITDDLNRIFATIKSRCQWVLFSQARPDDAKKALTDNYGLTDSNAHFLAHLSSGRIGKAISLKDSGGLHYKNDVLDKFSQKDVIFNEDPLFFDAKREEILDQLDIIISWYRDLFILKNNGDESLVVNVDRISDLKAKADTLSHQKIQDILGEALKTRTYIGRNANPKLALTNLVIAT